MNVFANPFVDTKKPSFALPLLFSNFSRNATYSFLPAGLSQFLHSIKIRLLSDFQKFRSELLTITISISSVLVRFRSIILNPSISEKKRAINSSKYFPLSSIFCADFTLEISSGNFNKEFSLYFVMTSLIIPEILSCVIETVLSIQFSLHINMHLRGFLLH